VLGCVVDEPKSAERTAQVGALSSAGFTEREIAEYVASGSEVCAEIKDR